MKVLLAAGGSGGHIFPAIALGQELEKREGLSVVYAVSRRQLDRKIIQPSRHKAVFFSVNPMPYKPGLKFIPFLFKLICDIILSVYYLTRFRPDVVVGFGGYTSGTIVLLASLSGIRTIIHEQNVAPGRANVILDKMASCVAVSFEPAKTFFKNGNIVFTGNPIRAETFSGDRASSRKSLGVNDEFTILVIGGSQGAASLNRIVCAAMAALSDDEKKNVHIIHITGVSGRDEVKRFYGSNGLSASVFDFVDDIHVAYSACDLAISRSGSAAVFELAAYGRPMILVPYPSKKNSQWMNAAYFGDKKAAVYVEEHDLEHNEMLGIIRRLFNDKSELSALGENARALAIPEAAVRLADIVTGGMKRTPKDI
jgi:UDP-N-acetylglucosamine--N-acetylmuramyl-(pentapeptide) pyrophosphoryl-undecaprenol N-acetylglucosamine transferase